MDVENYPGYEGSGAELMKIFYEQAKKFGTEFLNSEAVELEKDKTGFIIGLKNGRVVHSRSLIIALGTEKRKLNVPGETELLGRGVSYCATCDAMFFKDKTVAVVGGGNSAAKSALILSKIAKKVYIIHKRGMLKCDDIDKKRIRKEGKIKIIYNSVPVEIVGKDKVRGLIIEKDKEKKEIKLDGVFIEIGAVPNVSIAKKLGIKTDRQGYIVTDMDMATNVKGIFAAGDIVKSKMKQIILAAAQGAVAASSAKEYLSEGSSLK